ncbi:hypothetical protein ACVC7V_24980 [Hydrogenophaga sp. A37]|uniref:hypothetical protein n=1 Tax=Hydrogenophaga sp. A37 TaxID=1945864 RepID=UPI0009878E6E|nr:hypothetical protein [Hydrogenophaga sp. A37]OOG84985.1 hypothetical protein B0E41_09250 [Hydrogenophaga sp. A37]
MSAEPDDGSAGQAGLDAANLFRPLDSDGVSGLTIGLVLAALVFGAYAVFNWPGSPKAAVIAPPPQAATPEKAPVTPVLPAVASTAVPTASATPSPAGPQRCDHTGQVLYTDQACPVESKSRGVDVSDPLSTGGKSITLYRCKGAGQFWSRVHCQHRGAYVVRAYTVPADVSLADQIAFADNRMAELTPPPIPQGGVTPAARVPDDKAWRCKRLKEEIAALDAYARHPLPPGEQDRVRFERKNARDQQFRLHC